MPSINLLPWRQALRQRRRKEFLIGIGAAAGLAALVTLLTHLTVSSMIDSQNRRNELLKTEIAELDKAIEQILALEEQKSAMISRMEVIDTLQASRPEVVQALRPDRLDAARGRLPDVGQAERQEDRIQRRRAVEHARVRLHAQHRLLGVVVVARAQGHPDRDECRARRPVHPVRIAARSGRRGRRRRARETQHARFGGT